MTNYSVNMNESKIISYIGFAMRMNKAVYGLESVRHGNKPIYAIVYDATLGGDASKRIASISENTGIPIVKVGFNLSEQYKRASLKLIGIGDKSLADAIVKTALLADGE